MRNWGRRFGRAIALVWSLAIGLSGTASAATYLVEIHSSFGYGVSFEIDDSVPPSASYDYGFSIADRPGSYTDGYPAAGPFELTDISFYTADANPISGGLFLIVHDPVEGDVQVVNYFGPALFDGSTSAPILRTGEFAFEEHDIGVFDATVRISLLDQPLSPVPEPSAWTMLLAGFGAVGAVCRRRRCHGSLRPAPSSLKPDLRSAVSRKRG